MKIGRSVRKIWLVLFGLLLAGAATAAIGLVTSEGTPNIPSVFNPDETNFQRQTHFLVFEGSDTAGETAQTSSAYYNAIDPPTPANPNGSKRNFTQWLKNAGFIGQESDWRSTGAQTIITNQPGCAGTHSCTYGPNIVNADSHVIVLNAADLGFVRNQFVRCVPNCTAPNPI